MCIYCFYRDNWVEPDSDIYHMFNTDLKICKISRNKFPQGAQVWVFFATSVCGVCDVIAPDGWLKQKLWSWFLLLCQPTWRPAFCHILMEKEHHLHRTRTVFPDFHKLVCYLCLLCFRPLFFVNTEFRCHWNRFSKNIEEGMQLHKSRAWASCGLTLNMPVSKNHYFFYWGK